MTFVMAYAVLLTAGAAACAVVLEIIARGRGASTRWFWIGSLIFALGATGFAMFAPKAPTELPAAMVMAESTVEAGAAIPSTDRYVRTQELVQTADTLLPLAWLLTSLALTGTLFIGRRRFRLEHQSSKKARIGGLDVHLTESLGPAVAGVRSPVVFVPRWVLALDEVSQRLLVAHEHEHVKHRDTSLLWFGAASAALMPWNPVVWWMVRRLRIAVEQDCDARVLANHPDVRRYADLLLTAASRKGLGGLLAAHLGERSSDLLRRLEAMTTTRRIPWNRVVAATLVAAVLVSASCEAPRPDPLSPAEKSQPVAAASDAIEMKAATLLTGSTMPRYPEILRQAGVEGEVLASFVVNESGEVDMSTFKVIRTTHELFATAVRAALREMRFTPAEANGKPVRQLVQEPFTFSLEGSGAAVPHNTIEEIPVATGKRLAFTVDKSELDKRAQEVVVPGNGDFEVAVAAGKRLAFTVDKSKLGDGKAIEYVERKKDTQDLLLDKVRATAVESENRVTPTDGPQILRRASTLKNISDVLVIVDGVIMTGSLDSIDPDRIESIEVVKGAAAQATYGERAKNGVIQITTKQRRRIP